MANNINIEYGENFRIMYSSAKVKSTEVLCAKAVVLLPLFVSHAKEDLPKEGELITISVPDEYLLGTGYCDFEYVGLPLNSTSHLDFWKYINSVSQKTGASRITVDIREMIKLFGKESKQFKQYDILFNDFLNKIVHSRVRYYIKSRNSRVNDHLIGKVENLGDGIYVIDLGSFMIDSILNDSFTKKTTIKCIDGISSGNSRLLYEKLNVLIYAHYDTFKVDTLFAVMNFKKRTKAERDANFKELYRAIENLKRIGYIFDYEKIKGGKTGKEVVAIKFTLNKNFNKSTLVELDDEPYIFENTLLPRVNENQTEDPIEELFKKIGVNPEAIEYEKIQEERLKAEKTQEAITAISNAFAKKFKQ